MYPLRRTASQSTTFISCCAWRRGRRAHTSSKFSASSGLKLSAVFGSGILANSVVMISFLLVL